MVDGAAGGGDETLLVVEFEGGVVDEVFEFGYFVGAGVLVVCFYPLLESVGGSGSGVGGGGVDCCWQWSRVGWFASSGGGKVFAAETASYGGPQDDTVINDC